MRSTLVESTCGWPTATSPSGSSGQTSALLGVIALYSPKHTHDPLFLSNYVTINMIDQIKSTFGVGDAMLWGPQDYSMRVWVRTDQLTGLGLTSGDIINAIKAQNVQAAVGRVGARPISDDQQRQLDIFGARHAARSQGASSGGVRARYSKRSGSASCCA
jgi:multidrug efflux pump subunit AcrB